MVRAPGVVALLCGAARISRWAQSPASRVSACALLVTGWQKGESRLAPRDGLGAEPNARSSSLEQRKAAKQVLGAALGYSGATDVHA
jgi:hypothetical protein